MLLSDHVGATAVEAFNLLMPSNTYIARLELMGGMRWKPAEDDIIFVTEPHDFKGFMCAKSVIYQYSGVVFRSSLGLRVENMLNPVQADGCICIS
jgi:hypothetical protein